MSRTTKMNKEIRRKIREEIGSENNTIIETVIEEIEEPEVFRKSQRRKVRNYQLGRQNNTEVLDREEILHEVERFYRTLYTPRQTRPQKNSNDTKTKRTKNYIEDLPDIRNTEIEQAMDQMSNNTGPGTDEIIIEVIKADR